MKLIKRKYAQLTYHHYLSYADSHQFNVLPLAPPDWEAYAKKHHILHVHHLPTDISKILDATQLNTTLYVLNKLQITHGTNATIRIVLINQKPYIDPYFEGISENIFFNQHCFVPEMNHSSICTKEIKLRIHMLGGFIKEMSTSNIDILISSDAAMKRNSTALAKTYPQLNAKNIINATLLKQIFRRYFGSYRFNP